MIDSATPVVRVAVLGEVAVRNEPDGSLLPVSPLASSFLTALVLAPGHSLSVAGLVQDIWVDGLPSNERAALHTLVSRLRGLTPDGLVVSTASGYGLDVGDGAIDLLLAESLLERARASVRADDPRATAELAQSGLALWRGHPGTGQTNQELRVELAERASLVSDQLHYLNAQAQLDLGNHDEAVTIADGLLRRSPLSDALCALHIRALIGSGRVIAATEAYDRFRARLRDALGVDPSAELDELYATLLRQRSRASGASGTSATVGLRAAPNELIGRDAEVAEIGDALESHRLVSIAGTGGIGKTRVAQAVGQLYASRMDAVFFVDLGAVEPGADITMTLGATLDIGDPPTLASPGRVVIDALQRAIIEACARQSTLLILDSCEHVIDSAAAWVRLILDSAPSTCVLVTSRSPLGLAAETVVHLPPLETHAVGGGDAPSVRLFRERALAVRSTVVLPDDAVTRLCVQLDGLPLAIELAAARVRSMRVEDIEALLNDRFGLLTTGDRTAPERHRTLHAVIDWSWGLLTESQQALCRQLAVYPDGFAAAAASFVSDPESAGREHRLPTRLADLDSLVAQSLVQVVEGRSGLRYRMLMTVREFCMQRAAEAGESVAIQEAQAAWAHDFALRCIEDFDGRHQVAIFRAVAAEQENLLAILRLALARRDRPTAMTTFTTLGFWLVAKGSYVEALALAPSVEDLCADYDPPARLAQAHLWFRNLLAAVQLVAGTPRRAARSRWPLRRAMLEPRVADPLGEALAAVLLSSGDAARYTAAVWAMAHSTDPTIRRCGLMIAAIMEEDRGEIDAAIAAAEAAFEAAAVAQDLWTQRRSAGFLASLFSRSLMPREAIEWRRKAMLRAAQLGLETRSLVLDTALDQVALGELDGAEATLLIMKPGDLTWSASRLLRELGLAEAHLARGQTDRGLQAYYQAVNAVDWSDIDSTATVIIGASACLAAHVHAGRGHSAGLTELAKRLGTYVVHASVDLPHYTDVTIVGAAAVGLGLWILSDDEEHLDHERCLQAVEWLALSEALNSRQDLPSIRRDRAWDRIAARCPEVTSRVVDSTRSVVRGSSRQESAQRVLDLIRQQR